MLLKKPIITYTNVEIETIEKFKMDTKIDKNEKQIEEKELEDLKNRIKAAIDNTLKDNEDNFKRKYKNQVK